MSQSQNLSPDEEVAARRAAYGLDSVPSDRKSEQSEEGDSSKTATIESQSAPSVPLESDVQTDVSPTVRRGRVENEKSEVRRHARARRRRRLLMLTIIVLLVLLIVGAIAGFWILRWGNIDDESSIQGTWNVVGGNSHIVITEDKIVLNDDVAYDYVVDPDSKTIEFVFGALEGKARYRLSLDGNMLSIEDGEYDWASTLAEDITWYAKAAANQLFGNTMRSPSLGDSSTDLKRAPQVDGS